MARKKVKLAYITNDSTRKATFRKRKKGLLKKVSELSVLCGINACAIIYSPYDIQPEVWPSPMAAQKVINAFKEMPELEQSKKMVNQESFLCQRIFKAREKLKKQKKENREKEISQIMFQGLTGKSLHHLNMIDLNDLGRKIDQYLKEINKKVEGFRTVVSYDIDSQLSTSNSTSTFMSRPSTSAEHDLNKEVSNVNIDSMQRQQWFMDLTNPQDHLGFGGNEIMFPFDDNNHNGLLYNVHFP